MVKSYPYREDRKFFVFQGFMILFFIGMISLYHFVSAFGTTSKLFLYLMLILLWGYSEYQHRVKMMPVSFSLGYHTGKLHEFQEQSKKFMKKKKRNESY